MSKAITITYFTYVRDWNKSHWRRGNFYVHLPWRQNRDLKIDRLLSAPMKSSKWLSSLKVVTLRWELTDASRTANLVSFFYESG